jgi:hypothetical protein
MRELFFTSVLWCLLGLALSRFDPGCCCEPTSSSAATDCQVCLPGTAPAQYLIQISGMRDRAAFICNDCESLDGAYIVNQTVGGCWYVLDFDPICGYNRIELLVAAWGYYASFHGLGTGAGPLVFQRIGLTAPRDCGVSGLTLIPQGFINRCSHLFATCAITALP